MILLVHNGHTVDAVYFINNNFQIDFDANTPIASVLSAVSKTHPNELIIWVNKIYKSLIDYEKLKVIFHHKCIMASYAINGNYCISNRIGYVEKTPYTNIKNDVNYPTWMMSSDVGGMYAATLNTIINTIPLNQNIDFFLTTLAKHNMPLGLFCYSNPKLIKEKPTKNQFPIKHSNYLLFKFVKRHYKAVWVFNLFLCFIVFEKRMVLFPFLRTLFLYQNKEKNYLKPLDYKSTKTVKQNKTIDVLIPTMGRKEHLYNVLKDLAIQTVLPKNIIIIEQNAKLSPKSDLDYLKNQIWPFNIIHSFAQNTGVCKARNIGLKAIESDWCFFADDDIRFDADLIENAFSTIETLGVNALNLLCLQPHEKQSYFYVNQTDIFGSGTSIVNSSFLKRITFDTSFEFGFGEDSDYGMQLRQLGADIIYVPHIKITHLKAPIGGYRTKHITSWENDEIKPKPSPTIMIFNKKHYNSFQKNGYKFVLFLKFYKNQAIKNPFRYLKQMQKEWKRSEYWSDQLMNKTKNA